MTDGVWIASHNPADCNAYAVAVPQALLLTKPNESAGTALAEAYRSAHEDTGGQL